MIYLNPQDKISLYIQIIMNVESVSFMNASVVIGTYKCYDPALLLNRFPNGRILSHYISTKAS